MSKFTNLQINFDPLTAHQKAVLVGGLLGDAFLSLGSGLLHPYLKIERKLADKKYLEWQYDCFANFCKSGIKEDSFFDIRTNKTYYYCRFLTRALPELLPIYHEWYCDKLKMVPRNLVLTPLTLAIWFADDGKITRLHKSELTLSLATDGFTYSDTQYLADLLGQTLHATYKVYRKGTSKKGEPQYVIQASSDGTYAFIKYMESEFLKLSLERKITWSDVNLDFAAQSKRSKHYYQLADIILGLEVIHVKDIVPYNIYCKKNHVSEVLYNFFQLGYFTRTRPHDNAAYSYRLTPLGTKYFSSLQLEQQLILHRNK